MQLDARVIGTRLPDDAHEPLVRPAANATELLQDPIPAHHGRRLWRRLHGAAVGPGAGIAVEAARPGGPHGHAHEVGSGLGLLAGDDDAAAARHPHARVFVLLPVHDEDVGPVDVDDAALALFAAGLAHGVVEADLGALAVGGDGVAAALEARGDLCGEERAGCTALVEDFEGFSVDFCDDADGGWTGMGSVNYPWDDRK